MIFVFIPCNKVNLFTKIYTSGSERYHLSRRGWLPCVSCALKKSAVCILSASIWSFPSKASLICYSRPELDIECSAQKNLWRPKHPGVAKGGGSRGLRKYRDCSRAQQATFRNQLMDLYESRYLPHPGNPSLAEIGLRQISVGWSTILPSGNF